MIIWAPIAMAVLADKMAVWTGGIYYTLALGFSWFGTGIVQRIINSYRHTQDAVHRAKRQIELMERQQAEQARHRRADDEVQEEQQES